MKAVFKTIGKYKSLNILSVVNVIERRGFYAWLAIKVFRSKFIYYAYLDSGIKLPFSEAEKKAYEAAMQVHRNVIAIYHGIKVTMNQHKTGGSEQ